MSVEYNAVLVVSGVMFNFDGNKSLNISDNSRQFAQGTTELSQLLINESAKLDITIDIYSVKISFIGFQTYVQLSIFCAKIFEKCWVCLMVKGFFFTQICDLVVGLLFLSRPGIIIQPSNDLRGLIPILNKKKNYL